MTVVMALESALVNGLIKSLLPRNRPSTADSERPHYLRQPLTGSFPSGHASSAVTAALLLSPLGGRRWRVLLWSLALIVSLSRIHVRIHYASDVVGGWLVGAALGRLARRMWPL